MPLDQQNIFAYLNNLLLFLDLFDEWKFLPDRRVSARPMFSQSLLNSSFNKYSIVWDYFLPLFKGRTNIREMYFQTCLTLRSSNVSAELPPILFNSKLIKSLKVLSLIIILNLR